MESRTRAHGHEAKDVGGRPPLLLVAGLVALALLALAVSRALLAGHARGRHARDASEPAIDWPVEPPPRPHLQADPRAELDELRATQAARLSQYAWIDAGAGIVQVPIERALELVLERGLPTRAESSEDER